jgi:hypothetical protein
MPHTPGPWVCNRDGKNWRIEKPDGVTVMAGSFKPEFQKLTTFPIYIGEVHETSFNAYNGEGRDKPEIGEANAHLIAAAPELLEALKVVLAQLQYFEDAWGTAGVDDLYQAAVDKGKHAIAKAEGN